MTPKEALRGIKQAIAEHLHLKTGVSVEKHFEYLQYDTEIIIIEQALTELEELKRDVKRYFETTNMAEWNELGLKLSKVGKEHV